MVTLFSQSFWSPITLICTCTLTTDLLLCEKNECITVKNTHNSKHSQLGYNPSLEKTLTGTLKIFIGSPVEDPQT